MSSVEDNNGKFKTKYEETFVGDARTDKRQKSGPKKVKIKRSRGRPVSEVLAAMENRWGCESTFVKLKVPAELHRWGKICALKDKISFNDLMIRLVDAYVEMKIAKEDEEKEERRKKNAESWKRRKEAKRQEKAAAKREKELWEV